MFDLSALVETAGYFGVAGIIFAETGLFFGFFLPGDSLLFTAGILASQGFFNIWLLVFLTTLAAILGDSVGYWSGKKAGPYIFRRPDSFWFRKERVEDARRFFEKYGPLSIVLARFVPIVRTFTPLVAGVAEMRYSTFLVYNVLGAFLWAFFLPLAGFFMGNIVPGIDRFLLPLIAVIVGISVAPFAQQAIRAWRARKKAS